MTTMRILILAVLIFAAIPSTISPDIRTAQIHKQVTYQDKLTLKHKTTREIVVKATAYSYTGSRTFTGTWPKKGTIAVDPAVIPLRSLLYVEGYGWGIAEDTGGAIKGNQIDVFFENEEDALRWGQRMVKVKIKREEE